jgi:hydrogenase/urease accessory protein HupE
MHRRSVSHQANSALALVGRASSQAAAKIPRHRTPRNFHTGSKPELFSGKKGPRSPRPSPPGEGVAQGRFAAVTKRLVLGAPSRTGLPLLGVRAEQYLDCIVPAKKLAGIRVRKFRSLVACAIGLVIFALPARAHDPGLSALAVRIDTNRVFAELTIAKADVETIVWLDGNFDGRVSQQEFDAARPQLESLGLSALEIKIDGQSLAGVHTALQFDTGDTVHFQLSFSRTPGTQLLIRSEILAELPRGHKQYLSIRDDRNALLGEQMLDAAAPAFAMRLSETSTSAEPPPSSFGQFLWLGVEHIATGYDHLAFLLGLLIVGAHFRAVVKIITSFTIAHSITLALATLDLIRFPSTVIEPLIAASIMYVGIENIVTRKLERRWILAFVFGLVHGCGFATVLRELGIGANGMGVLQPMLGFNLGVELGQLALAAIVLPIIWKLQQRESVHRRCVAVCSILITLAGGYWLLARILPLFSR